MELLQLKYFCEAAESENFSHTAKKNGVPTSNISQTVKRLETELGVRLFLRSANKITLSDEGKTLYDGAKKALITLEDTVKKLRDSEDNPCGELKLLILAHRRTVTLAIEEYKLAYPNVQIIINHSSDAPYSDFDFVISDGAEDKGNYDTELLLKEKILLAVSNKSPLSKRVGLKLSDLSNVRNRLWTFRRKRVAYGEENASSIYRGERVSHCHGNAWNQVYLPRSLRYGRSRACNENDL
jgi:DNA-binding transcriptional LysR family regulator